MTICYNWTILLRSIENNIFFLLFFPRNQKFHPVWQNRSRFYRPSMCLIYDQMRRNSPKTTNYLMLPMFSSTVINRKWSATSQPPFGTVRSKSTIHIILSFHDEENVSAECGYIFSFFVQKWERLRHSHWALKTIHQNVGTSSS